MSDSKIDPKSRFVNAILRGFKDHFRSEVAKDGDEIPSMWPATRDEEGKPLLSIRIEPRERLDDHSQYNEMHVVVWPVDWRDDDHFVKTLYTPSHPRPDAAANLAHAIVTACRYFYVPDMGTGVEYLRLTPTEGEPVKSSNIEVVLTDYIARVMGSAEPKWDTSLNIDLLGRGEVRVSIGRQERYYFGVTARSVKAHSKAA